MSEIDFRPEDPAYIRDPYPMLARLRDEDPCHWSPRLKAWVVTRYEDVKAILLDRGMSSDRLRPFFATLPGGEAARIETLVRLLTRWMVFRDPPEHTRLRRLTAKVFNVRSMNARQSSVERLTARLLAQIGEREEIDFIADFAGPLPALVIMDMLGVPEGELERIKRLSDDLALFIGSSRSMPEKYGTAEAAAREMAAFFRALIAARRAAPQPDLLTELVHLEDGGDRFDEDELVASCLLLLFAGHETTTNHIANGLAALLAHPGELERLRARPDLAPQAVEELLRYDGPSGVQVRIVAEPHMLHGRSLSPGERLFVMLNAANRDARAYPEPDRVILDRDGPPQLAFGFGLHICLGFPLARLEGRIALPAVLAHWRGIAPAGEAQWLNSMVFRGMSMMPLSVRRASG